MFRNIESVLKHFDRYTDYDAYKLYRGKEAKDNKGGLIDESPEEADHGSCKVRLESVLHDLGPGTYLVQFKKNPKATTDIINANFEIAYTPVQAAIGSPAGMGGVDTRSYIHRDDVQKIVEAEIGKVTAQNEMQNLRREFEEFKNKKAEKQEPIEKIMENPLVQAIGAMFLNKIQAMPKGIAGPEQGQVIVTDMNLQQPPVAVQQQQHTPTPQDEERERKIQEIFAIATQIEGNGDAGIELLHKLAHYCLQQQEQPMFQMIKQQVMQTVPQPVHFQ